MCSFSKRAMSVILLCCIVFNCSVMTVAAVENNTDCIHEHTAECGYAEGIEASCKHSCDVLCGAMADGSADAFYTIANDPISQTVSALQTAPDALQNESDFEISNGYLTGYHGAATNVLVPASVTRVCSGAFSDNETIASITFPSSVAWVEDESFQGCLNLEKLIFTTNTVFMLELEDYPQITQLEINAGTETLLKSFYSKTSEGNKTIESLHIGEGITKIEAWVFDKFTHLSELTLPDSLITVGQNAFSGCSALTNLALGSGTRAIEGNAFADCTRLNQLTLNNGLESIHLRAFSGCSELTEAALPNTLIQHNSANAGLIFEGCSALSTLTIPNTVAEGILKAEYGLEKLTALNIIPSNSDTVLPPLVIPEGGEDTRPLLNLNISKLNIGEGITEINFETIRILPIKSLTIPATVTGITKINGGVWDSLPSELEELTLPQHLTESFFSAPYLGCQYLKDISISKGNENRIYETIVDKAFSGITSMTIQDGITELRGFSDLLKLESISFPDGLTDLEGMCNLPSLRKITIPESLISIPENTFNNCTGIIELSIPSTLYIHGFRNCIIQKMVVTPVGNSTTWQATPVDGTKELVISVGITAMTGSVGSTTLTSVQFPANFLEIGMDAQVLKKWLFRAA